jgi:hypothetical protein
MGAEYVAAQNIPLAYQHFTSALGISPQDPHALHGLGTVFPSRKKTNKQPNDFRS